MTTLHADRPRSLTVASAPLRRTSRQARSYQRLRDRVMRGDVLPEETVSSRSPKLPATTPAALARFAADLRRTLVERPTIQRGDRA